MTGADSKHVISGEGLICYALKGVVEQAINSVPVLGSMIPGMLEGVETVRAQLMMDALALEVKRLNEDKLDLPFINSEEFLDLFCRALRARSGHRSKMKAKLLVGLIFFLPLPPIYLFSI